MPLISLNLHEEELQLLDALVAFSKERSFTPKKVNRSSVIRELTINAMREIKKADAR